MCNHMLECINETSEEMENNIFGLSGSEWCLEVIMASSNNKNTLRPSVRIKMDFTAKEEPVELVLSLESFADLRYKVAEALKILNDIKENKTMQHLQVEST